MPSSFARYEERLKRILGPSVPRGKVHRLPPSAVQLARAGNQTPEFKRLVTDLFDADDTPKEQRAYEPAIVLAQLLFRSGYYHALIGGESTRPYRERVYLWLLGRCQFARSFQMQGFSVEPFTDEQLEGLGPDPRIRHNPSISRSSIRKDETKRWWLVFRESVENGWIGKRDWEERKGKWEAANPDPERIRLAAQIERILKEFEPQIRAAISAGYENREIIAAKALNPMAQEVASGRVVRGEGEKQPGESEPYGTIESHSIKAALLILSLYNDNFLDVPRVLVIDPGWRKYALKDRAGGAEATYEVTATEWPKFERFLRLAEHVIFDSWVHDSENERVLLQGLGSWRRFSVAAARYLRASFAIGHSFFRNWRLVAVILSIMTPAKSS